MSFDRLMHSQAIRSCFKPYWRFWDEFYVNSTLTSSEQAANLWQVLFVCAGVVPPDQGIELCKNSPQLPFCPDDPQELPQTVVDVPPEDVPAVGTDSIGRCYAFAYGGGEVGGNNYAEAGASLA
jgi:hypothetical protein